MNDPMTAADPVQLFRETWTTYQKIIASDYMFHRELTRAIASSLMTLPDTPLSVLDLGCGDASQITGILNAHHIAEYRGCDLSLTALELARHHLEPLGSRVVLLCEDMLSVLRQAPGNHYDLVFSSFALHHLSSEHKSEFFTHSRRVLRENGCVILLDIMREIDETRQDYLDKYFAAAATQWTELAGVELSRVENHARNCDFPETSAALQGMALSAGLDDAELLDKCTWHHAWRYRLRQ